jgi:hypothetical protein
VTSWKNFSIDVGPLEKAKVNTELEVSRWDIILALGESFPSTNDVAMHSLCCFFAGCLKIWYPSVQWFIIISPMTITKNVPEFKYSQWSWPFFLIIKSAIGIPALTNHIYIFIIHYHDYYTCIVKCVSVWHCQSAK